MGWGGRGAYLVAHIVIAGAVHVVVGPSVLGVLEVGEVVLVDGGTAPGPLGLVHSLAHRGIYFKL